MKPIHKFAAGVVASLGLSIAVAAVYAHPGQMGSGMQHERGEARQGSMGEMQHGAQGHGHGQHGDMQHGGMGGAQGHGSAQNLATPEERAALRDKMRNATTPEERRQIAAANHAGMHKHAQENGITLPEGPGPRAGTSPKAPDSSNHTH